MKSTNSAEKVTTFTANEPRINEFGHCKEDPTRLALDPLFKRKGQFGSLSLTDDSVAAASFGVRRIANTLKKAYFDRDIAPHVFHATANLDGTPRRIRSDGLETAIQLMITIICHTDWASGRVGYYTYDQFGKEYWHDRSLAFLGVCARMPHKRMPGRSLEEQYAIAHKYMHLVNHKVRDAFVLLSSLGFIRTTRVSEEYQVVDESGKPVLDERGEPVTAWASMPSIKRVNFDFLLGYEGIREKDIASLVHNSVARRNRNRGQEAPKHRDASVGGTVSYLFDKEPEKLARKKSALAMIRPHLASENNGTLSPRALFDKAQRWLAKYRPIEKEPAPPDKVAAQEGSNINTIKAQLA